VFVPFSVPLIADAFLTHGTLGGVGTGDTKNPGRERVMTSPGTRPTREVNDIMSETTFPGSAAAGKKSRRESWKEPILGKTWTSDPGFGPSAVFVDMRIGVLGVRRSEPAGIPRPSGGEDKPKM
jgi:hypothetical protein